MRRSTLASAGLAVVTACGTLAAQAGVTPHARIGIMAGVNSSTVSGSDATDASRRTGFMAGVLLVAPLSPAFAIQPEVYFTQKGAKSSDTDFTADVKFGYLEVPVLLRYEVPVTGGVKPFLYAGPQVSFKTSCTVDVAAQGAKISEDCDAESDNGETFKSVDYGVIVGGGLGFDVGGRMFTIGARYDHSLSKLSDDSKSYHRVISVLASFEFPWGR